MRAGPVLLLAHDLLDLLEHAEAERQPGVDAGGGLADQAGAQHQLVADDLGVGRAFLEDRAERLGTSAWRRALGASHRGWQPRRPVTAVARPTQQAAQKQPQAIQP